VDSVVGCLGIDIRPFVQQQPRHFKVPVL
jgi:hypothetical protein